MNAKQISKLWWRLYKLHQVVKKAAAEDPGLVSFEKVLEKLQREAQQLAEGRKLEEAKKKDKGEVLWTLYFPRDGETFLSDRKVLTRTPNTLTSEGTWFGKTVWVVSPESAYKFDYQAYGHQPWPLPDPAVMRNRAERVAKQWPVREREIASREVAA